MFNHFQRTQTFPTLHNEPGLGSGRGRDRKIVQVRAVGDPTDYRAIQTAADPEKDNSNRGRRAPHRLPEVWRPRRDCASHQRLPRHR